MAESEEEPVLQILVAPYRGLRDLRNTPPGASVIAAGCGHPAWLSTEGQAFLNTHPTAQTRCLVCGPDQKPDKHFIIPGAVAAAEEYLGPDHHKVTELRTFIEKMGVDEVEGRVDRHDLSDRLILAILHLPHQRRPDFIAEIVRVILPAVEDDPPAALRELIDVLLEVAELDQ